MGKRRDGIVKMTIEIDIETRELLQSVSDATKLPLKGVIIWAIALYARKIGIPVDRKKFRGLPLAIPPASAKAE